MPVYQVIAARCRRGLRAQHAQREVAELAGQGGLVQVLKRPGGQVPHENSRRELGHRRHVPGRRARENIYLHAAGCQALGNLHDINVQAARISGSRLLKR